MAPGNHKQQNVLLEKENSRQIKAGIRKLQRKKQLLLKKGPSSDVFEGENGIKTLKKKFIFLK